MSELPSIRDLIDIVEPEPWFSLLEARFGIDPATFDGMLLHRPNRKILAIVNADHAPPPRPKPDFIGMAFIRATMQHPKLTTAAAMTFGVYATRNVINLSREQTDAYLSRQPVEASEQQLQNCTESGYVLLRHDDAFLGVGLLRRSASEQTTGTVESYFPKAWALPDDITAFG